MAKIMNRLYYGDNLEVLRKYVKDESIDLCYIDPPFNSKRNYNQIYNNVGTEDRAQAQAFIDTWTWDDAALHGFEAIQTNYNGVFTKQSIELIIGLEKVLGKGSLMSYLISMTLRLAEIFRVLKPTGSFYLHCDPTASHYLKLVLDTIFVPKGGQFLNEIAWCYNVGGKGANHWARKHDNIFFYSKSKDYFFDGKAVGIARDTGTKSFGGKMGVDEEGRRYQDKLAKSSGKYYRYYLDEPKIPEDFWTDINSIQSQSAERLGYPTQKPEALLERIIKASSKENDVVLDAYCGCGTTIDVAQKLKRKWIGIDITYQSISLILKRMREGHGSDILKNINLFGVPKDMESAIALANKSDDKTRKEFEKWAVLTYSDNLAMINEKKGGDAGIDGIAYIKDLDEKNEVLKQIYFSVKSDKKLSPDKIRDLNGAMQRDGAVMGILITLYPMKNLIKESKKYGLYKNGLNHKESHRIEVISVQDMLDNRRLSYVAEFVAATKNAEKKAQGEQPELF